MDIPYMLGLLLLLLSIRNSTADETSHIEYDDYYDYDEYDFNSSETTAPTSTATTRSSIKPTSKIIINTTPSTTTPEIIHLEAVLPELPKIEIKCPEPCQCNKLFTFVNCSNRNIENVPFKFPESMLRLDLSKNAITEFQASNFENCTNLKELLLDNNKLNSINFKNFSGLTRLERLSLANNHITKIDSNTFSNLAALKKLNLNNNPIVISSSGSFLNQEKLQELYLNGCRMRNLHDDIFQNLSGLITLDLDNNDFNKKINIQAFIPMKNLEKLQLPELERDTISELCNILTSIDLINFKNFNISCFVLVSGSSFEESTVTAKPLTDMINTEIIPTEDSLKPSLSQNETRVNKKDGKSISRENSGTKSIKVATKNMEEIPLASNNSIANNTMISNTETSGEAEDDHKVAISSQAINQILIGIIIVAVIGIVIGIICRRDICGIKTKMCRTKRPPPTDIVRPAEEIPLNKV